MRKLRFPLNIQTFATQNTKIISDNTATYGKRMSETEANAYYDKTLKDALYEEYSFEQYFDTITLPKNNGKTMKLRKSGRYVTNGEPLVEGVVPKEDEPMSTFWYSVSLDDWGGYISYTDQVDIYSLDSGESTRLQRNQGNAVGELFQLKARDILYSTTNHWFATPVSNGADNPAGLTLTSLDSARKSCGSFNLNDLRKIKAFLRRNHVKGYSGKEYVILISPEIESDLLDLSKNEKKFTFVEITNYQNGEPIMDGEIGRWNGFRFVVDNGITETATVTVGGATKHIHGVVILGKYRGEKGAKIVKLEGYGNPETIVKPLGSAGTNDPLNQKGTIGWKCLGWGGVVLYDEAVMLYECVADQIVGDFTAEDYEANETARPAFIGGYDKNGDAITPVDKIMVNGGAKVDGFIFTVKEAYNGKATATLGRYVIKGTDDLTFVKALLTKDFGDTYGKSGSPASINLYTTASCATAYTESSVGSGHLNADTTVYVKKVVVDKQAIIDDLTDRVEDLETAENNG